MGFCLSFSQRPQKVSQFLRIILRPLCQHFPFGDYFPPKHNNSCPQRRSPWEHVEFNIPSSGFISEEISRAKNVLVKSDSLLFYRCCVWRLETFKCFTLRINSCLTVCSLEMKLCLTCSHQKSEKFNFMSDNFSISDAPRHAELKLNLSWIKDPIQINKLNNNKVHWRGWKPTGMCLFGTK